MKHRVHLVFFCVHVAGGHRHYGAVLRTTAPPPRPPPPFPWVVVYIYICTFVFVFVILVYCLGARESMPIVEGFGTPPAVASEGLGEFW